MENPMIRRMTTLAFLAFLVGCGVAAAQSSRDLAWAERNPFQGAVAVWYGSHLETTGIHDWVPIKKWNGPFHPLLGNYRTGNRKVLRQHLKWMRRAGIDVIFYDAVRVEPEQNLFGLPKQKTLKLLMEELSHQEQESRKLKLVVWLERWNSNPSAEEYRFALDFIQKNLAAKDYYFQFEGKPLVVRYFNAPAPDFSLIDQQYQQFFTLRRITPEEGTKDWTYFGPLGSEEEMTINPGADGYLEGAFIKEHVEGKSVDTAALRKHGETAGDNRADGKTFENQLLKARQVDPKLIFISGWNDWAWCLQIEPAKEYEFKYLDISARLLGRTSETAPYRKP
jgi:hypothetical protein